MFRDGERNEPRKSKKIVAERIEEIKCGPKIPDQNIACGVEIEIGTDRVTEKDKSET